MDITPNSTLDGSLSMTSTLQPESATEGRKKKKTLSDRFLKHRFASNSERPEAPSYPDASAQQRRINDPENAEPQTNQPHEQSLPVLTRRPVSEASNYSNGSPASVHSSGQEPPRAVRFSSKSKALDMSQTETQPNSSTPNKIRPPLGLRRSLLDPDEDESEPELPDEPAPKPPTNSRPLERTNEKPPLPDNAAFSKKSGSRSQPLQESPPSPEVPSRSSQPRALAARSPSPDPNPSSTSTQFNAHSQPAQASALPPQQSQSQAVANSSLPPLPSRALLTASKQAQQQPKTDAVDYGGAAPRSDGDQSAFALNRRARSNSSTGVDSAGNSARVPEGRTRAPSNNFFRPGSALSLASDGAASNISTNSTLRQLTTREAKAK